MIHIVFQASDVDAIKAAMELDETLQGNVILIRDDYAVGPLAGLDTPEGWKTRRDWWMAAAEYSPYMPPQGQEHSSANAIDMVDDKMSVHRLKEALDADAAEEAWVWMAQNQHDVCGYYWLVSQLKDYQGRIQVLYLNNLPFLTDKGTIFYPVNLFEIRPSEFRKAKKLARPVTLSEFEIDPDEWNRLCQESAGVRLLEGGKKIIGKEENYYDKDILVNITPQWQKFSRVIHNTLHRMKPKTGDLYLAWRLRRLVAEGAVQQNGDLAKGWTGVEVKLPAQAGVEEPAEA